MNRKREWKLNGTDKESTENEWKVIIWMWFPFYVPI